jgi:hypothetical protein
MSLDLWLQFKGDFVLCLEESHQQKCWFINGINCLVRPVTDVQMNEVLEVFVYSKNKSISPTIKHVTDNSVQNYVEIFEI